MTNTMTNIQLDTLAKDFLWNQLYDEAQEKIADCFYVAFNDYEQTQLFEGYSEPTFEGYDDDELIGFDAVASVVEIRHHYKPEDDTDKALRIRSLLQVHFIGYIYDGQVELEKVRLACGTEILLGAFCTGKSIVDWREED